MLNTVCSAASFTPFYSTKNSSLWLNQQLTEEWMRFHFSEPYPLIELLQETLDLNKDPA